MIQVVLSSKINTYGPAKRTLFDSSTKETFIEDDVVQVEMKSGNKNEGYFSVYGRISKIFTNGFAIDNSSIFKASVIDVLTDDVFSIKKY